MSSVKEKVSNAASAAKEHLDIYKAKIEEKAEKAAARTKEEKVIAHERRKAKEAEANMKLHEAKAEHASEKLQEKHPHPHLHGHHEGVGIVSPTTGTAAPTYPLGGTTHNPPGHNKHL